jgi:hypothetical protein
MNARSLYLSDIRLDGGTQCRAALDADHIASLAEAWTEGAKMPAVIVFNDGTNNWLADGFHRYHAAEKCDFKDILAEVRSGTRTDAVKFALGANAAHGMRRSNADKRRAVEIALKEFPNLSSVEVSRICAVSHTFVDKQRPEPATVAGSEARIGADGKIRKLPTRTPAFTEKDITKFMLESFLDTAAALREIRDRGLYKSKYSDFDAYCMGRWGVHAGVVDRNIELAGQLTSGVESQGRDAG